MKRIKIDKNQLNKTISFESKTIQNYNKHALLPQKRPPLQNIQNYIYKINNEKVKTEQSFTKNQNEVPFNKQNIFNISKSIQLKSGSIAKAKCQSIYKKDVKKIALNLYPVAEIKNQNTIKSNNEELFIVLNIEKTQQLSQSKMRRSRNKTKTQTKTKTKTTICPFANIAIKENQMMDRRLSLDLNVIATKQRLNLQFEKLQTENQALSRKLSELTDHLNEKISLAIQKQQLLQSQIIKLNSLLNENTIHMQKQFAKQRMLYNQRINQLTFQNHQLNAELLKQMELNGDTDLRRKIEFMQSDIRQYQKREDIYCRQIQTLHLELTKNLESTSFPLIEIKNISINNLAQFQRFQLQNQQKIEQFRQKDEKNTCQTFREVQIKQKSLTPPLNDDLFQNSN